MQLGKPHRPMSSLSCSPSQNRAIVNLFRGPNQIAYVSETLERIERGDLKLRVRALEAERAL